MKYKAIIFDMDGTIITTETAWAQASKHLLKTKGNLTDKECQEIMPSLLGASLYTTCAFIKKTFNTKESIEDLMEEKQQLAFSQFKSQAKFIEGFDRFHNKISSLQLKSAIATNANQRSVNEVLQYLPLKDFFQEHIYSIDLVNRLPKPLPDIYLFAAEKINIHPKDCIAIEDSAHGIAAAVSAGMFCIGINTGNDRNALKQAHLIIESYDDLEIDTLIFP